MWKSERETDIMVYLASLAGERMFFDGDNTTGVGGDMGSATTIAMEMEGFHAMGQTLGSHRVTKMGIQGERVETGTDRMWLDSEFGRRVEFRLEELFARVSELLEKDRIWVLSLAHALEAHKTVPGEDITAIIEGHQGPTIDGRVYHSPAFQAQLEEYHAAALQAHKVSDRVAIPLPVPPDLEPVHIAAATRYASDAERRPRASVLRRRESQAGRGGTGLGAAPRAARAERGTTEQRQRRQRPELTPEPALRSLQSRRCISTTSSHRPNFRPTSRSVPTSSKPHAECSAIDASLSPAMRAITEWKPCELRELEQLVEEQPPDAATLVLGEQVHRVLDGGGVGRARPERRQRPEPHHVVGGVFAVHDRDDRRMGTGVLVDPEHLLVEGAGDHVEQRGRLGDVVVVDRSDPRRVASLGEADLDAHRMRKVPRSRWVANLADPAPLAQLVEHFHGKEGVYGSSP